MDQQQQKAPKWMLRLQIVLGILLIVVSVFLYYALVPRGLDEKIVFVLLGFGILNLFFGRLLFILPEKQKGRVAMLKEEKEREQRKEAKKKAKESSAKKSTAKEKKRKK